MFKVWRHYGLGRALVKSLTITYALQIRIACSLARFEILNWTRNFNLIMSDILLDPMAWSDEYSVFSPFQSFARLECRVGAGGEGIS